MPRDFWFDDKEFLTLCNPEKTDAESASEPTIVTTVLADLLKLADRDGGDVRQILGRVGLQQDFLKRPPDVLALRQFVAVSQTASDTMRRCDFGWRVGVEFTLENLGPVGAAMLSADTVGTAVQLLCDALPAVQGSSNLDLVLDGDSAIIRYRVLDPNIWPRCQDAELTLAVVARVVRQARGVDWRPDWLAFEHPAPDQPNERRARFGVKYNADANEIRFPASHLNTPMPDSDHGNHQAFVAQTLRQGLGFTKRLELPARLRQAFFERLGKGSLDQTEIAREMGLSRRGLRRRLADYDTSYSQVLADCRSGLAAHRLCHSPQTIAEIAYDLGYSDQSAFERAFRRDVGVTPTRYRQIHGTNLSRF